MLHVVGFVLYGLVWVTIHVGVLLVELAFGILMVLLTALAGCGRRRRG